MLLIVTLNAQSIEEMVSHTPHDGTGLLLQQTITTGHSASLTSSYQSEVCATPASCLPACAV